jgi:hypothetical protein
MKITKIVLTLAGLSLAIPTIVSPVGSSPNRAKTYQRPHSGNESETKIFRGTVWMNAGRYVLRDTKEKAWYQLDDQRSAARFDGDYVRVTGILDIASNTIRVQRIEEDT